MRELLDSHLVNHFWIDIDESSSMMRHQSTVVQVVDGIVADLGQQSRDYGQETRLSVYAFSDREKVRCLVWDVDVLRIPSIAGLYRPNGLTALVDCTMLSISDMSLIPQKYGDHAFAGWVITDGMNNDSVHEPEGLARVIDGLPENHSLGVFVPDSNGRTYALRCGFPSGSIKIWDPSGRQAVESIGAMIRDTSSQFLAGRSQGIRGYRGGLFAMNPVSDHQVTANLAPLHPGSYVLLDIVRDTPIRPFVEAHVGPYVIGDSYYQLTKREKIQARKKIAFVLDGRVYTGSEARQMLGLPDYEVKVDPYMAGGKVFIQSTSVNRSLKAGQQLLVLR